MSKLFADEKPGHITTLVTGRSIDLLNPSVDDIFIEDIACSLSRANRYRGFTPARPYTVGEHCLLGLDFLPAGDRFEFLMHDASEAYLGDMVGPHKNLPGMSFYREMETTWTEVIGLRFGLKKKTPATVKVVDERMLATEMRDLRGRRPMWRDKVKAFPMMIPAVGPSADLIERDFLEAFDRLSASTEGAKR